jgi:hypothetical protein
MICAPALPARVSSNSTRTAAAISLNRAVKYPMTWKSCGRPFPMPGIIHQDPEGVVDVGRSLPGSQEFTLLIGAGAR